MLYFYSYLFIFKPLFNQVNPIEIKNQKKFEGDLAKTASIMRNT